MTILQGKVISCNKASTGFRIEETGEQWYNMNPGVPCPERFDVISFDYNPGTDGRLYMTAPATIVQKGVKPSYAGGLVGGGGGGAKGGAKSGYDNLGQQVGNCVTNATALVASGKVPVPEGVNPMTVIMSLAGDLMKVGDKVKADHGSPAAAPAQAVAQAPVQAAPAPVAQVVPVAAAPMPAPMFDDEIPF